MKNMYFSRCRSSEKLASFFVCENISRGNPLSLLPKIHFLIPRLFTFIIIHNSNKTLIANAKAQIRHRQTHKHSTVRLAAAQGLRSGITYNIIKFIRAFINNPIMSSEQLTISLLVNCCQWAPHTV